MRARSTLVPAVLMVVAALVFTTAPAQAHNTGWRTSASWGLTESGGDAAVGWLRSANSACLNNRKVKVFKVRSGRDQLVGVDRRTGVPTGSGDGYINASITLRDGKRYYIKALRKNVGTGRHTHICKPYKARSVLWSDPS